MNTCKVIFAPSSGEVVVDEGTSILDAARMANVYIDSHCSGKGTCGKCKIRVVEGTVSPVALNEIKFINENERELGYRLACVARAGGDVTVFLTGENVLKAKAAEKLFSKRSDVIDPAIKRFCIEVNQKKEIHRRSYLDDIKKHLYEKFGLGRFNLRY